MDCGKEYIEMCRKAVEIQQEERDLVDGDVLVWDDGTVTIYTDYQPDDGRWFDWPRLWLPRQDQLQEMIAKEDDWLHETAFEQFVNMIGESYYYASDEMVGRWHLDADSSHKSMEQLWLAFVMKVKFNKTWDTEKKEWV